VVVDSEQTDDVLFGPAGIAAGAARGARGVCSTVAPDYRRACPHAAPHDIGVIDAPTPADRGAGRGHLSMMAAGAPAAGARCRCEAVASRLFRRRRAGDGSAMKIVNNMLAGINLAAAAEAMALAERMGMDLQLVHDVICASSGGSWIFADRMPRAIAGDYAPLAAAKILTKDVGLALAAAAAAGVPAALAQAAHRVFAGTVALGHGEADDAAVIEYYRALIREGRRRRDRAKTGESDAQAAHGGWLE
jgi:3-hydroxyisobutyrate dehydrogenase-like beta-hydroxyacid dehydrogenase